MNQNVDIFSLAIFKQLKAKTIHKILFSEPESANYSKNYDYFRRLHENVFKMTVHWKIMEGMDRALNFVM